MESQLLTETPHGTWYKGMLIPAIREALSDRDVIIRQNETGVHVALCDKGLKGEDPSLEFEAEFGNGRSFDQAWRYALGAYFGPLDEEYPGDECWPQLLDAVSSH